MGTPRLVPVLVGERDHAHVARRREPELAEPIEVLANALLERAPLTAQERPRGRSRFGPGRVSSSPGMAVSSLVADLGVEREVGVIERTLAEHGPLERRELAQRYLFQLRTRSSLSK